MIVRKLYNLNKMEQLISDETKLKIIIEISMTGRVCLWFKLVLDV